jgi:hypothetical protein
MADGRRWCQPTIRKTVCDRGSQRSHLVVGRVISTVPLGKARGGDSSEFILGANNRSH